MIVGGSNTESQPSSILQEPTSCQCRALAGPPKLLAVQCLWQNHSKSYDNDTVYSSGNGAAIGTTAQERGWRSSFSSEIPGISRKGPSVVSGEAFRGAGSLESQGKGASEVSGEAFRGAGCSVLLLGIQSTPTHPLLPLLAWGLTGGKKGKASLSFLILP